MNNSTRSFFTSSKITFKNYVAFCGFLLVSLSSIGQTNPTAQTLPYTQNFSTLTGATPVYPAGFQGWNIGGSLSATYPTAAPSNDRAITVVTNTTAAVHVGDFIGKMGLYSSNSAISSICLSIVTTGTTGIQVSFDAMTQRNENTRINELGLQYRVGTSGTFTNIASGTYQNTLLPTNTTGTGSVNVLSRTATLPIAAENQSVVQLRWVVRQVSGSGNNVGFAIDNISITGVASAKTSTASGNWSDPAIWSPSGVPTSADNAIIASGHVVVMDSGTFATRNSGTTTTVNAGGILATSQTYVNNGTTTINGSFQLNSGGWVSDAGGTNPLVYGTNGTLIFNATYGANNGNYWPTTNGPVNVTVNTGSALTLGFNRTVTGTFQTAAGVTLSASVLTLNGICQLNGGGFFNNAPTYGAASTLVYNTSYGVYNEWTGNGAAGVGIPANVRVQSGTLSMPTTNRGIPGNITIDSTCSLVLNGASGDLFIGGNWTNAGAFTANGRAVFFNGAANQTITNTAGETFSYLINNKTAGNLILANNVTVNATAGSVLQILNAGAIDLNGRTLTLANNGGGLQVTGGARSITSSVAGGILSITGSKTVTSTSSGTLTLGANVTTSLTNGINFGASLSTVQGRLIVNGGGFVNTNAPVYANTSTLEYNGVTGYGVNNEWTGNATTAGVGTPQNVTLTSSSVNLPNTARSLAGNLIIATGSTLNLNGAIGADLNIGGNWTNSGTFNPNSRQVTFRGAAGSNSNWSYNF
jgi:hypothetical protein